MMALLKRFYRDSRGIAAIEFALTAPFMCVILLGVAELNNYMTAARKTAAAAYTAADLIAQETDITSSELSELLQASRKVLHPLDDSDLTIGVSSVRFDDTTGNPGVDWTGSYNSGSVSNATTLATDMGEAGQSVIIVTAEYTYTPLFSLVMSGSHTLEETAITRPRFIDYVGLY